jgi:hypothetical protein
MYFSPRKLFFIVVYIFAARRCESMYKNIDAPMLTRVQEEIEYRIDACRVTRGVHIEHLYLSKKLFRFSCGCEQFH